MWDILEEVIQDKHVLLNRAPTLHRLGIQAFRPKLIEGLAIRLHPLVCAAFNADFDGDQMAVHVPLSQPAQQEARELMSAKTNLLKPSAGDPIITPTQDMVLGCYFLTQQKVDTKKPKDLATFSSPEEAILAYEQDFIHLQDRIRVRLGDTQDAHKLTETTAGRLIFNEIVPNELGYVNDALSNKSLSNLLARCLEEVGPEAAARFADDIKKLGFEYATISGISIASADIVVPEEKESVLGHANSQVDMINSQYSKGWLTADER